MFERKERLQIVPADITWESGDRIIYLLYTPKLLNAASTPSLEPGSTTIDVTPEDIPLAINPNQKQRDPNGAQDYLKMAREILKKSGRNRS
jgi:hypothetical protein